MKMAQKEWNKSRKQVPKQAMDWIKSGFNKSGMEGVYTQLYDFFVRFVSK
jgi:hypothetical protein